MQMLARALTIIMLAALAACAKPTPYQPAEHTGLNGYEEETIGTDHYRIRFTGNAITTRQTVDRYLLYRAAELTEDKGFDYFIVSDREDFIYPQGIAGRQSQISIARRQELLVGSGIRSRFGEEVVEHYGAEIDILMQNGELPDAANAYLAVDVITRSRESILRREDLG